MVFSSLHVNLRYLTAQLLPHVDRIVMLKEGRVVQVGFYAVLKDQCPEIVTSVTELRNNEIQEQRSTGLTALNSKIASLSEVNPEKHKEDTSRRDGSWLVYLYYFRSAGYLPVTLVVACFAAETFCNTFTTILVQWWVDAESKSSSHEEAKKYLGLYAMLFIIAIASMLLGCWVFFITFLNNTSINLHANLLNSTLKAPMSFLQQTDVGSLVNRFGQDMELVDMTLPIYLSNFVFMLIDCFFKLIILCIVAKYLAISVPVLAIVLYIIQSCYLRTSRQIRLLDIESKAPLYAHFLETIQGLSTIRAFGWQADFESESQRLLNQSQKPVYMLFSIQQWLTLTIDLVVGGIAIILIAIITGWRNMFQAASIGVALNILLTFNQSLAFLIKMWTMTEVSIGSIARVQNFVRDTPAEDADCVIEDTIPEAWPHGEISFKDVTARYK